MFAREESFLPAFLPHQATLNGISTPGMRWKTRGAKNVLALRSLIQSDFWEQFWGKIDQFQGANLH